MEFHYQIILVKIYRFYDLYERPDVIASVLCLHICDLASELVEFMFNRPVMPDFSNIKVPLASGNVGKSVYEPVYLVIIEYMQMNK